MIKIGDLVKFREGFYTDEEGAIYKVLEVNGDRVLLEFVNTSLSIRPQSIALLNELELVSDEATGKWNFVPGE